MATAKEKGKIEQLQDIYDSLLEERSRRLGVSLEDAAKLSNERPLFIEASERRAQRLGTSMEALLSNYVTRIKESTYPSPLCLKPEQVQAFSEGGELTVEQKNHLEGCEPCRSLLESCQLSPSRMEEIMDNIRRLSARAAARSAAARPASVATGGWAAAATNFLKLK
jgi:hypothetical protein